jgi:hypothetical protein
MARRLVRRLVEIRFIFLPQCRFEEVGFDQILKPAIFAGGKAELGGAPRGDFS